MPPSIPITLDFLRRELTSNEQALLESVIVAHRTAAKNNANLSKAIAQAAFDGSGSFLQSMCAACLSIGGAHAPIAAARQIWRHAAYAKLEVRVKNGDLIPGFGNSFYKDRIDPAFEPVLDIIREHFPSAASQLEGLTHAIWRGGKQIYPNAAIITAAVCEIIGVPDGVEETLFILARIPVWAEVIVATQEAI